MESSACRRRASDADQSARAYSATAECEPVMVKEEPDCGVCGVSEAAVAEGLYADHEIKDEIICGPELVQQQDVAFTIQNMLAVKEENVRVLKPRDDAEAPPECRTFADRPHCNGSMKNTRHKLYRCSFCSKQFITEAFLNEHNIQIHKVVDLHEPKKVGADAAPESMCFGAEPRCSKSLIHTRQRLYSCSYCNKQFFTKAHLTNHQRIHTGEKPYGCDVCNKRFTDISSFIRHKRIHSGLKLYSCDICNKRFTDKSTLTSHIRIHSGEKSHSCHVCNKRFTLRGHLTKHMRIHTGEKVYSCDLCSKRFTGTTALTSHKRMHTGEKPYSCGVCNKRFVDKSTLTRHVRIHSGESYGCSMCNKRFTDKSSLTRHLRIHTGEKPYGCDACKRRFRQKSAMISHKCDHTPARVVVV
ncbi:uncharacterized protein [Choristoneura fumiferana]|uniref:uncharacterized protein n=1 Tax=Choristoneura fumiferana TaxID=7141 RepID=UPI003D15781A